MFSHLEQREGATRNDRQTGTFRETKADKRAKTEG